MAGDLNQESLLPIYEDLRRGHPTAPRRLLDACAEPLASILATRHRSGSIEDVEEAVVDAVLALISHPERYDPEKSALSTYLVEIGSRRLIDQHRRSLRGPKTVHDSVELHEFPANNWLEMWEEAERNPKLWENVERFLAEALPDETDRRLWKMKLRGQVRPEEAAKLFGLDHVSADDQRRACKQKLDRVEKAVRRAAMKRVLPERADRSFWKLMEKHGEDLPIAECARILGCTNLCSAEQEERVRSHATTVRRIVSERLLSPWDYL